MVIRNIYDDYERNGWAHYKPAGVYPEAILNSCSNSSRHEQNERLIDVLVNPFKSEYKCSPELTELNTKRLSDMIRQHHGPVVFDSREVDMKKLYPGRVGEMIYDASDNSVWVSTSSTKSKWVKYSTQGDAYKNPIVND